MTRLEKALSIPLGYNATAKREFELAAKAAVRRAARILGLQQGTYDIRWNPGGIAVSGEVTLHHDRFYLQIEQSCMGPGHEVLYRSCRGRKDYTGGPNHWMPAWMVDGPTVYEPVHRVMEESQ